MAIAGQKCPRSTELAELSPRLGQVAVHYRVHYLYSASSSRLIMPFSSSDRIFRDQAR
jgi:hypothetical protein